ncbi:MAG TPA: DedA family protein [Spirochaetota bacterium]|nr:DedA family protein [Spirochaetota bacterium]
MEAALNNFITQLPQNELVLYLLLFASAVFENLFPPVPGDTITVLGAFFVGKGILSFPIVYAVTTLGSTCGFMILFYIGYFLEREFFMKKDFPVFSAKSIVSAEKWFEKYGYYVVLINRFIPGIRSVVSVAAGIAVLRPQRVFLFALASAAVWNFIWIYAGYSLGNNWEQVREKFTVIIGSYNIAAVSIMTTAFCIYLVVKKFRERME